MSSTCCSVLGHRKKIYKDWITQESLNKIQRRGEITGELNRCRRRTEKKAAQEKYSIAHREVKQSIKRDNNRFLEEQTERAEQAGASGNIRLVHQITNTLAGKQSKPAIPVKDQQSNSIFTQEEKLARWKEHFEQFLNRPPQENPPDILPPRNYLPINSEPSSKEEIAKAIKALKSNKAAGPDFIPQEALKVDIPTTVDILYGLFVNTWEQEKVPCDWKEGHLIKLSKKGDLSNCNNYRGITLLSIPGKVFNIIILERMKLAVDGKLRENQAGFGKKKRSYVDHIATLRIILEQSTEWNSPILTNFIDYEKAYDSLDRQTLRKLMRHYGIPQKLVNIVKSI
ncbi:endonuclease-reverse transcriptase [Elysia marginata]|uniref:Endonuclease-reverse transcriptase n=1 Tax=Elysia marginata TaxID=1093978 RepID=A0AAV4JAS4_9GAST|nr:endonuclease-reverse transcriptase [Elysia marginata]